jgi:hypothetical protein
VVLVVHVTEARTYIHNEEVKNKRSLSEAFAYKLAATLNFISKRQNDKHSWNLNGFYRMGASSSGPDGVFPCLFDMAITGFAYHSGKAGTTDITEIDIHYIDADGTDNGSIFSTLPSVAPAASDNTTTVYDQINSSTIANPTGHTLGVLSKSTFTAGQVLRLDLDQAMSDANNFQFTIFFRPI